VLTTADGVRLEAGTSVPPDPWAAAILAHPHPLHGGSMRTGVPAALFERLPAQGVACLRFNFRGVEGSDGTHGQGVDERLDVAAAAVALAGLAPGVPLVAAGWSFGADVSLAVGDDAIDGWCAIAPPLATVPVEEMVAAAEARPKRLLVPEHDQLRPPAAARTTTAAWVRTEVVEIQGADHFLAGRLGVVADEVVAFLRTL
jgi:alpha/beta superfamily hydrolase